MESKDSTTAMEQTFRTLTISDNNSQSESLPTSFPRFPDLPAEIRLQIWAYAILNLPGRIIPIQDISGKPRTPAYFTCRHPHPLISTVSSEARTAVIETLGPLFIPGNNHTFIAANLSKDILMLGPNFYPKALKRLIKAIGEDRVRQLRNIAIETEIGPGRSEWGNLIFDGGFHTRSNLLRIYNAFPELETLSVVPHEDYTDGSAEYRGELRFVEGKGWNEWPSKFLREFVRWAKKPFEQKLWETHGRRAAQFAHHPLGPEVKFVQLGIVGGEVKRCWDPVKRVLYWGLEDLNTVETPKPCVEEEGKMYLGPVRRIKLPDSMNTY
jgi:hypothetical protein